MPQNENGNKIKNEILEFYDRLAKDPNHRYRSWEHCYGYFRRRRALQTKSERDIASLHLAFYLASWGMYRGSSALLWKDYKVHVPAVSELSKAKYSTLWDLQFNDSSQYNTTAKLIVKLSDELKKIYYKQFKSVNGKRKKRRPSEISEILTTKILLGTIGCTPACDEFFRKGFRRQKPPDSRPRKKLTYSRFSEKFLCQVFQFYREYKFTFFETEKEIERKGGIDYPPMKLVDMYFWQLGKRSKG